MSTIADLAVKLGLDSSGFSKGVGQAQGDLSKLEQSVNKVHEAGKKISDVGKAISIGVTAPVTAASIALLKFGSDAQKSLQIEKAFNDIASSAGRMGREVLAGLKMSSQGLITNTELMKSFNLAANLVSKDFALKLPEAMKYLGKVSAATGQDMSYLLDSLVKGVGRLSPMILDNLAVQVSLTDAYDKYAKSIGKTADELTKAEQQTAVMNETMRLLKRNTASMGDEFGTTGDKIKTAMGNAKDAIGKQLAPALKDAGERIIPLVNRFAELFKEGNSLHPVITVLGDTVNKLIGHAENLVNWLSQLNPQVVENTVKFTLFLAVLGPTLLIVGKLTKAFSGFMSVFGKIGTLFKNTIIAFEGGNLVLASTGLAAKGAATGVKTLSVSLSKLAMFGGWGLLVGGAIALGKWQKELENTSNTVADSMRDIDGVLIKSGQSFDDWRESVNNALKDIELPKGLTEWDMQVAFIKTQMEDLVKAGVITADEMESLYWRMRNPGSGGGMAVMNYVHGLVEGYETLKETMWSVVPAMKAYDDAIDYQEGLVGVGRTAEELEKVRDNAEEATSAAAELAAELQSFTVQVDDVTSLTKNFGSIVSLAESYTTELENIAKAQERIKELEPFEDTGGRIDGVWMSAAKVKEELENLRGEVSKSEEAMQRMADQMTLDMLQATIAIGGITQAEAEAYFKMAVDMGVISQDAADKAMEAYGNAVDTINDYVVETKTGIVEASAEQYWRVIRDIESQQFQDKIAEFIAEAEQFDETWTARDALEFGQKVADTLLETGQFGEDFSAIDALEFLGKTIPVELKNAAIAQDNLDRFQNFEFIPKTIDFILGDTSEIEGYNPPTRTGTVNYQLGNTPTWNPPSYGPTLTPRATGGRAIADSVYLVGERGPELFIPDVSGNVIPNWQLDVSSTSSFDERALARAVATAMREVYQEQTLENEMNTTQKKIRKNAFTEIEDW